MTWTRRRLALGALAGLLTLGAAPAMAGPRLDAVAGHLAVGWAKLTTAGAPGGSISLAAGLDYPVAPRLRAGIDVGYDLLGSRTAQRGSQFASVDYGDLNITAFLHWLPPRGPVGRVSIGPTLVNAHADLSVTAGGASFSDLAVQETGGGVAGAITLMPVKAMTVKAGIELGGRYAFLSRQDWALFTARLAVHY